MKGKKLEKHPRLCGHPYQKSPQGDPPYGDDSMFPPGFLSKPRTAGMFFQFFALHRSFREIFAQNHRKGLLLDRT